MMLLTIIIMFSLFSSSRSHGHQVIQLINQISGGVGPPPQFKSTKHYHNLSSHFHDQFWPDLCHINHYQHISGSAVVIKTQLRWKREQSISWRASFCGKLMKPGWNLGLRDRCICSAQLTIMMLGKTFMPILMSIMMQEKCCRWYVVRGNMLKISFKDISLEIIWETGAWVVAIILH